jgi:DNA repair exonuclease SbcCD ATPase subunit
MPKAKKKSIELEENEFLKELIDEVKAIDPDTSIEIDDYDDDTPENGGIELGMGKHEEEKQIDLMKQAFGGSSYSSSSDSSDNQSTAFINLKSDLKKSGVSKELKDEALPRSVEPAATQIVVPDAVTQAIVPQVTTATSSDRTIAVAGARKRTQQEDLSIESTGLNIHKVSRPGQVFVSADASLAQSETLKMAQQRIHELENEVDTLRRDNDDLASAGEIVSKKLEDLQGRALKAEKEKKEISSQLKNEILIIKGHLQYKETELSKAKTQIEDLDLRIKTDFKKIRVRERELENRLELVRAEKQALMRSKDERILDLQRKVDQFKSELDVYRSKVQDLNKSMEDQQEQMRKTVRALRVALSNLEHDSPIDESQLTEPEPESGSENSDE